MMDKRPDVSVVMPVYRAEQYLPEIMEAFAAQTCKSFELIAIDDGSPDNSGAMLDEYAKQYSFLRVIHKENGGIYRARETGIREAKGKYIGFCDNDDLPMPELYQRLYEAAEEAGADMSVCTFVREEMETGRKLSHEMTALAGMTIDMDKDPTAYAVVNPAPWNKLVKAEILKQGLSFEQPPRILEDVILNSSVCPLIHKIVCIPDMLYRYRIRRDSTITTINKSDLPVIEARMKDVRVHVEEISGEEKILKLIDSMAFIHFGTSVVLRRIQGGDRVKDAVGDARRFLETGFPLYKRPVYGLVWNMKKHLVMLKPYIALLCFRFHLMGPLFAAYRFVTEKLHMEIKW